MLGEAESDLCSITRAREIQIGNSLPEGVVELPVEREGLRIGITE